MDFTLSEEQQAAYDLALTILGDASTPERLTGLEERGRWFDDDAWSALADAGLVGLGLAEDVGGAGQGLVAAGLVLRAQGATVAPIPLLSTVAAALAIDAHGDDETRQRWLPGVAHGTSVLTVAIQEPLDDRLLQPSTTFSDGALTGTKSVVEFYEDADAIVVTATGPTGPGLYLVERDAGGISAEAGVSTRLQPVHDITFDATPAVPLGTGDDVVEWLVARTTALVAATQLGVTETALTMTAEYTTSREQFGRPIATFQAVTQRLADQYINVEGIRLCTLNSLWRLENDLDAIDDTLVAKWWASERATDIAHATQHCHGGMGVSVDYPLHRYTLWNKHLTTTLGAGTQTLRALGRELAG